MQTKQPKGTREAVGDVMPVPEVLWARPLWIMGRYGIGVNALEKAWRAGKITRSKLDDGRAGTVIYLIADVERWINERINKPKPQPAAEGAIPHPY